MTPLWYIVGALATYYLALSVATQDGPFAIFRRLRDRWQDDQDWKSRGVRCVVCMSCWASLLVTVLLYFELFWPVLWLALAGGAVLIDKVWKR